MALIGIEDTIIPKKTKQAFSVYVAALLLLFSVSPIALALGLGEIRVKSALGQSLSAQVELLGADTEFFNVACVRARVVTFEGQFLASVHLSLQQMQKRRHLLLTTHQHMNEPAVNLIIDMNCEMQLHREFAILLDPPELQAQLRQPTEVPEAMIPVLPAVPKTEPAPLAKPRAPVALPLTTPKAASPVTQLDAPASVTPKKNRRKSRDSSPVPARDVLRLSDEVSLRPIESGLRMSDVLSMPSGPALVENMAELKAAQARMAAILRDESPTPTPQQSGQESADIAKLKREAEQLKKQNQIDKASLQQLQSKSNFDYWLLALSVIATLAILVILFLLYYIKKHLGGGASWWEEDDIALDPPTNMEVEIDRVQANYEQQSQRESEDLERKKQAGGGASAAAGGMALASDSGVHKTPSLEETNSSIFNFFSPRATSVKVEEISDVTQEAEFWISMNDPQRAIEILAAQEKIEHPDSPVPWLYLLDLYRTVSARDKYEQLRQRFIAHFNASIPEFDEDLSHLVFRQLEDFPHLIERICANWSSPELLPYLESLLIDDRNGSRGGFDLPVYRDILMLLGIARELERLRLAESKLSNSLTAPKSSGVVAKDPVEEAEINSIDFEMIEFPLADPDKKV